MVKFSSEDDNADHGDSDNEYDEEGFEDEEEHEAAHAGASSTFSGSSPKGLVPQEKSPGVKRVQTPGAKVSPKKEKSIAGGSLEDYLKGLASDEDEPGHHERKGSASGEFAKAVRPLDGTNPSVDDAQQRALMKKLGYSQTSSDSPHSKNIQPTKDVVPTTIDQIAAASASLLSGDEHQQARNVENFLMELFPERYDKKKGGKKGKSDKGSSSQAAHLLPHNIPPSKLPAASRHDAVDEEPSTGTDVLGNLDSQLKLLRKDLKVKDDKIARLKEHNELMTTHMDRLKGEVARLNAKLHDAEMELEAKESRLQEALKAKKKAVKKVKDSIPSENISTSVLEAEQQRFREREQALMDAIEELTTQNEDLIIKLRESMQRELELSSKRAALVSHNLLPRTDALPSIYGKDGDSHHHAHHGVIRSQSEPAEMAQRSRPAGKKKKRA